MAFRADALRAIGGFDPALGIGSVTHSGEDLAAYFEVITRGYQIAYEPGAIVYHAHRETFEALRKSLYGRSVGFAAYLTRSVIRRPRLLPGLMRVLPRVARSLLAPRARLHPAMPGHTRLYERMINAELRGLIYGPIAYFLSRWALRRAFFSPSPTQNG
jgi:GT2 family glycosyltransferase